MSIPLSINGAVFNYPQNFDTNWGIDATGWAQAVTSGMLQKAGGSFPLSADVNFGASFGLIAPYFTSHASNPATVGTLRLASADPGVVFRNNANSGNLVITTDAFDNLLYNGHILAATSGGPVTSITGTVNQVIASSPTGNVTLSLPQSIATTSDPIFDGLTLNSGGLLLSSSSLFFENPASQEVIVSIPASGVTTWNLTLPSTQGSNGQFLQTNGFGVTSWVNATGSGTINSGTTPNIAYYATSSTTLSDSGISRANLFLADGSVPATGAFNLNSNRITNIANSTATTDAVAFGQVQYAFQPAIQTLYTSAGIPISSPVYSSSGISATITPTSATNRIKITVSIGALSNSSANALGVVTVFRNGGNLVGANGLLSINLNINQITPGSFTIIDAPASTSSTVYTIEAKTAAGLLILGGNGAISIILEELR